MRNFGCAIRIGIAICMATATMLSSSTDALAITSNKVTISMVGKYDSADTAAIRAIDTEKKQIRFRNHATGKTYTLDYDNTSMMYDARGTILSAQMLEVGEIVDVTFLKSSKHITTLNVSKDAWVIDSTRDHELVRNDGTARIKDEIYRIDNKTLVMADGDLAIAENVLSTDKIKVSGIGREIYSVIVTGGHGYVSLSSDVVEEQSLVGAWIELDNEVIHKISPNMLLSAPEGQYNLQIIGNGANYQSEVNISRNQETVVDTSDITITKPKEGLVTFEIVPDSAEVFVDGKKVLTGVPQSVQYGYHNLKIMAEGYITQNRYLKVGTAKSIVSIELEKDSDDESSASSLSVNNAAVDNSTAKSSLAVKNADASALTSKNASASTASTVSSNSSSDSANKVISGYYIYFDKPVDAELYFDGYYIGTIPTSVQKVSGNHEVILKRSGYETISYRIKIDKSEDNVSYSFSDLVKKSEDSSSSSSTSSASSSSSSSDSSSSASSSSSSGSSESSGSSSSSASSASGSSGSSSSSAATNASTEKSSESTTSATEAATKESSSDSSETTAQDSREDIDSSQTDSSSTGKTTKDSENASDAASEASGEN